VIDSRALLHDLQQMVKRLEADLRERADDVADVRATLEREYTAAKEAKRTADAYEIWREDYLTQVAVAWVLGCVFVRFLEDNGLIDEPRLSGPGDRLRKAKDHHTLYFQDHPHESDREYLLDVFREVAQLPAAEELFDARHNLIWEVGISGDGATALLDFWQKIDPATGQLVHDFTDPEWSTRFLGDLYQDLSEAARKKYALLQTPIFVEEFILDRTLTPAIQEFGFREVRMLDPACGSGHFLLGGFERLFRLWVQNEPRSNPRELAQQVLNQVYGVDLNPFAVAIARFRLLLMALRASSIARLKDAPAFHIHVEAGDSLLHGRRFSETTGPTPDLYADHVLRHVYFPENHQALDRILGQQYHIVVGNPPYITMKDKALNQAYRVYGSCHRQYSMAVPFMERFFDLTLAGAEGAVAGFLGMITANSFMKREFGKKLIEQFIPRWDLTHVVDTSGAYIPGHGTPTVILFARHRRPVAEMVRAVLGIRGEPHTPDDPAKGLVWTAILNQIDRPSSESEFVSVTDMPRKNFEHHPWSVGGGGAAELKDVLDDAADARLKDIGCDIGFLVITGEDNCLLLEPNVPKRRRIDHVKPIGDGESIRDWACDANLVTLWPNTATGERLPEVAIGHLLDFLWPYRTSLKGRKAFGVPIEKRGIPWWALRELYSDRLRTPLSIAFAFVATHNHFVVDRGDKVFNRSAPVIKLPPSATEDEFLALVGLLNSSTACFWMKQEFQPKSHASQRHHPDPARGVYEFTATGLERFPIPARYDRERFAELSKEIDRLGIERARMLSARTIADTVWDGLQATKEQLARRWRESDALRECMIALQEEIDWLTYRAFGLVDSPDVLASDVPLNDFRCPRGERPFERLGGRRSLVRHAGKVVPLEAAEAPPVGSLAEALTPVWERREHQVKTNTHLKLIERLEYKRVWRDTEDNIAEPEYRRKLDEAHLHEWLLNRLEDSRYWPAVELTTCAKLADRFRQDTEFMQVAELYRGRTDFELTALVTELVESEAVPFLPVLRYKPTGLRNRAVWERTWELQRREDAGDAVGEIPVPPKYTSADFRKGSYWRLRGKLDVPKERFIIYPHAERDADPTPVIAWAGWDHLQQAQALAGYYVQMKEREGWSPQRLTPLLAGLLELIPRLKQWHNAIDPTYGVGLGDYFADFVEEEARALGVTLDQINGWTPT
jgi:hypothetical protein